MKYSLVVTGLIFVEEEEETRCEKCEPESRRSRFQNSRFSSVVFGSTNVGTVEVKKESSLNLSLVRGFVLRGYPQNPIHRSRPLLYFGGFSERDLWGKLEKNHGSSTIKVPFN